MQLVKRIRAWWRRPPEPEGPPISLADWYERGQQLTDQQEHLRSVLERRTKETANVLGVWPW